MKSLPAARGVRSATFLLLGAAACSAACGGTHLAACADYPIRSVELTNVTVTGWTDVAADFSETPDGWSRATLRKAEPGVAVRLVVELRKGFSAGLCELMLR